MGLKIDAGIRVPDDHLAGRGHIRAGLEDRVPDRQRTAAEVLVAGRAQRPFSYNFV